ncbi:MAG TPA: complex I NDUFA9 subunit family protein [Acidiferrobacteraceae bacterium]|nr:complex I NDUFA9 subunit family protein [Acidiferrobacteraceae bacterium]
MTAMKICVLGGTGFVGQSIAARLSRMGHEVHIISRRRERHRRLLVIPTVKLIEGDPHDMGLLRTLFQDVDAVINLVGILNEKGRDGKGFEHAHYELANKVMQACTQTKVKRLLHMSALHASEAAPSHYLRSKGRAEKRVHQVSGHDINVTSFRPSVIFGPGDSFLNRFAGLLRQLPFIFPLACPESRFQPIHVENVAQVFCDALGNHETYGQAYNLCGPRTYTLQELVEYVVKLTGARCYIYGLNDWQSWMQAAIMEWSTLLPWVKEKLFSLDNYRSLSVDSICPTDRGLPLGITADALEDIAPGYLLPKPDPLMALRRHTGRG